MRPIFSVVLPAVLFLCGSARADVRDPAAAQALFSEGKKLMGEGKYPEHTLIASAPGKRGWKTIVEIVPAGGSAKVIVPPLDDEPAVVAETPLAPSVASLTPANAGGFP